MKALRTIGFIVLFVVGIPLVSNEILEPYMSRWIMSWEMSKSGYAIVAKEYEQLPPCGRLEVRKLMGKGHLVKDDMTKIYSIALGEKKTGGSIQVNPAPDYGDAVESTSSEFWRNITGSPTESNAKTRLFDMASADSKGVAKENACL